MFNFLCCSGHREAAATPMNSTSDRSFLFLITSPIDAHPFAEHVDVDTLQLAPAGPRPINQHGLDMRLCVVPVLVIAAVCSDPMRPHSRGL